MYEYPVKYFEKNLIFNSSKNECWAVFKINGFNYDFKSAEKKINILNSLARFIANIGVEAKIHMVPVSQDIDNHYNRLITKMDKSNPLFEVAKIHSDQVRIYLKNRLKRNGNANDYRFYVYTKLKIDDNILRQMKNAFVYFIKEPVQSLEEYMGADYKDIAEKDIEMFVKLSNEYLKKQSRRISISTCNEMDIQWLIKRPFYRGLGEFKLKGEDKNTWNPFTERIVKDGEFTKRSNVREIMSLTNGEIDISDGRTLKVYHGDGRTSYQTFMPVAFIPDGIVFPGGEWLLTTQDFPIQVEVLININTTEHKESLKKITNKRKEIVDQIEHIEKGADELDEIPEELLEGKQYANDLEAELKTARDPIANASITFCIFSDNEEELNDNANFIKEYYEDRYFVIERPISDQLKLFMEFMPGTGRYISDYIHPLPPRTLAGTMIGATRLLGDNLGPYIGTTISPYLESGKGLLEKNVFLDISRACSLNRSASAAFLGTLGGGKSFSANLLFYLNVLYGGLGLAIDPKGERTNWIDDLPEFKGNISITTLSSKDEDKGKLDPFSIYKHDFNAASDLAMAILSEYFKISPQDDEYIAILQAIKFMKDENNNPSMVKLAKILSNFPENDEYNKVAKRVGRRIDLLRETAMAGLLFGNGDEEGLNFDKIINILQIQNLVMPDPDKPKEDYTQEELLSTVLMIPIASFARQFMHSDRRYFKMILLDEAWALKATVQGKQMMNALVREGRALNSGCLFIGHSTKDMNEEGIKNNISYKFCFKATDIKEIKSILEFLNLDDTEENIEIIKNLGNGECVFQDLDGRVGKLKFDAVHRHLIEKAFNTNPDKFKKGVGNSEKTA